MGAISNFLECCYGSRSLKCFDNFCNFSDKIAFFDCVIVTWYFMTIRWTINTSAASNPGWTPELMPVHACLCSEGKHINFRAVYECSKISCQQLVWVVDFEVVLVISLVSTSKNTNVVFAGCYGKNRSLNLCNAAWWKTEWERLAANRYVMCFD